MKELMNRIWKKEEGFSLIELIIVIAILAIIAAIALPQLLGNVDKANKGKDESNGKMIADAIITAVAQNPELEGTVLANVEFIDPGAAGTNIEKLMTAAVGNINGDVPVVASNDYGTVDAEFFVNLTAEGEVQVVTDTGLEVFPNPALQ